MKSSAAQLPLLFDAAALQADLAAIPTEAWIEHYRGDHYEGAWSVAPLRSVGGHPAVIHAAPGGDRPDFYKNTPWLEQSPAFQAVIGRLQCRVNAVRLMSLGAGARILEHTDDMGEGDNGELRLHLAVQTNPGVQFWVDGALVPMRAGEFWFADFNLPHRVENNGDTDRIHLVLDCTPNDWLRQLLEKADLIARIRGFLQRIGIESRFQNIEGNTFLPGLKIENGTLCIDPEKLLYPGDILHEAGHIAVTPEAERRALRDDVAAGNHNNMGDEIATILWSFAALRAAGIPVEKVFHPDGYKGQSDWHIEQLCERRNYIGLPLLEWMGLAAGPEKAAREGLTAFPEMLRWLRG